MLFRNQLRAIYPAGTEVTGKIETISQDSLAFALTTAQYLYLGFHQRFTSRYFYLSTVNSVSTSLTVEAYDGTDWTAVKNLVDDTQGFTRSGWIGWNNDAANVPWEKSALSPITDVELYWVRITTGTNLHASTALQAILNLFLDDRAMKQWYPEMISDTRYLPTGATNFYEQYRAATNLVTQELIRLKAIDDESQVLDFHEVQTAAAHAAAYCILSGIPNLTEAQVARMDSILEQMKFWVEKAFTSFDTDDSGELEEGIEDKRGPRYVPRGGY